MKKTAILAFLLTLTLALGTPVFAQDTGTTGGTAYGDQTNDDNGTDWGWLGLIGLAGLLGLRRREPATHTTTRTAPVTR